MSISDELEKLDELRQRGVLSFREFQALKAKLLHLVDEAETIAQLNEIKPLDDAPKPEVVVGSVDQPSTDASAEVPPFDSEILDAKILGAESDPDDKSLSQLASVSVVAEVPELDISSIGSSQFEKIEIPDEALRGDSELDLATENLNQLEKNELVNTVARLDSQLKELRAENEVAQVDRAWERERAKYKVVREHSHHHMPTKAGSVVAGVAISVVGLLWMTLSLGGASRSFIPLLFGFAVVFVGVATSLQSYKKAEEHERARRRYKQRRRNANRNRNT